MVLKPVIKQEVLSFAHMSTIQYFCTTNFINETNSN